jgi:hypothetical protein
VLTTHFTGGGGGVVQHGRLQATSRAAWGSGGSEMGVDTFVWHMHFEWLVYGI